MHASTAAKAVDRIIDVFPTGDKPMARTMLAGSLQGVVAQTLLPKAEGGRVAAFEILVGTNAVRNLIRENQVPQIYSMIQTGSRYGMVTMEEYVQNLLTEGVIDREAAREALLQVTEEVDSERDGGEYASAALGGGKIDGGVSPSAHHEPSSSRSGGSSKGSSSTSSDGGYSF